IAQKIETQWAAAFPGWPVTINTENIAYVTDEWRNRVQLLLDSWPLDFPDPQRFLSQWFTPSSETDKPVVSIPEVTALCAQADASTDQPVRLTLYQQAEQLLLTQGAAIPLYQPIETTAVRSRVARWRLAPTGMTPLSVWQSTYIRR